ncbi:MAG: chromophore lyase CpcT/CpeT [Gammaproteobacteria bacterium]|nr:chromophore lyase CpcT/CpeT [Gammaproteobacteria bacterium]
MKIRQYTAPKRPGISHTASALLVVSCSAVHAAELDGDLERFLEWFPAEYDNHEQVWQEDIDQVEHRHERMHHIFAPMAAPAVGQHTFFVQQYLDADEERVYRQRLYNFTIDEQEGAIRLDIYSFRDEAKYRNAHLTDGSLEALAMDELITRPGCEVYWVFQEDHFKGYMHEKTCTFMSERSGKQIFITDDLKLTENEIWIRDEAFDADGNRVFGNLDRIHHKNRKVRYFKGWGGVKQAGPGAAQDDDNWHFMRDIMIHDEGQIIPIPTESGELSGYSIQLARLTQQSTRTQVLKLGLIEDRTGYTVAYSWANPDAKRIGINLRWAQIGLHLKPEDENFGF